MSNFRNLQEYENKERREERLKFIRDEQKRIARKALFTSVGGSVLMLLVLTVGVLTSITLFEACITYPDYNFVAAWWTHTEDKPIMRIFAVVGLILFSIGQSARTK